MIRLPAVMTDPSDLPPIPPGPASADHPPQSPAVSVPQPSTTAGPLAGLHRLWILLVRALILGSSISLGWLAGALVAQVWPSQNPEPPLQERVMGRTSETIRKLRQLPRWWQGDGSTPIAVSESPIVAAAPAPPPPELSATARQQLESQLVTLQQTLDGVEAQLTQLESQLGQPPVGSLESRLQQLQRLTGPAGSAADPPPAEPPGRTPAPSAAAPDGLGSTAAAPYQEPEFSRVSDRIFLPSALLFVPQSSRLTPAGQQWLDAIVPDLRRYGPVTLLIGSHTDGPLAADQARQLTFQQALAIQQYLAPQLEAEAIRWVILGYGKTRPTAVGEAAGTQARNQRIEIGIVPR
ncbi:MAG TPA: OmpA family protein [Leptolyngbyaceae cyanobacterium M65_K2018_010]|nr:OmpA family protein [Leptolyngbyaceae cyanobacterium M65_K2018_010]